MKLEELSIARRGKLVVIEHPKYEIEFNLTKGTWNYSNQNNKTIIKNAVTKITLNEDIELKTTDAGFREFNTEPRKVDVYGNNQTFRFSYETQETRQEWNSNQSKNLDGASHSLSVAPASDNELDSVKDNNRSEDKLPEGTGLRVHTYLTCYSDQPYILLKVGVENLNNTPVGLRNISLIEISSSQGSIQLGGHPSQYRLFLKRPPISPNASVHRKIYDGFNLNQDNTLLPYQDGILHDSDSKNSFIFGFITSKKLWPRIQIGYQVKKRKTLQGLTAWSLYHEEEIITVPNSTEILSEVGFLDFSEDTTTSYKRFIERLAAENGNQAIHHDVERKRDDTNHVQLNQQHIFSGWSLSKESTEKDLSANYISEQIKHISQNQLFKPLYSDGIEYIHLESGWQTKPGELKLDQNCFPQGMKPIVEEIHANGYKAGISIDPLSIDRNSEIVKQQQQICLRTKHQEHLSEGKKAKSTASDIIEVHLPNRSSPLAILDISHPTTQKYIRKIIKQIVDEWGFDLVKIDMSSYTSGLLSIAHNVEWSDSSLTSTELYRLAVNIINEAIEDTENDVTISCYNSIESVGIGNFSLNYPLLHHKNSENSEKWHHHNGTKHRLSRYISYFSEQNSFWSHSYGNISVDEPRPMNEVIVEMTTAALSGSSVLCSNIPTNLSTQRAELVSKLFPIYRDVAKPIERFDDTLPRILHLPIETKTGTWDLVALYNWEDHQEDMHLNLDLLGLNPNKDYLVHDFWMRQYLGIVSKNVTLLNIPPRTAKLLCIREEQQIPQLLSTDLHYTQGCVEILSAGWDRHSQSYLLIYKPIRQTEGTMFIHVPEDYIPIGVSVYGSAYRYKWDKPIYQLTFNATDTLVQASIQFTKTSGGPHQN